MRIAPLLLGLLVASGLHAKDVQLRDGKILKKAELLSVDSVRGIVKLMHEDGVLTLPIDDVPIAFMSDTRELLKPSGMQPVNTAPALSKATPNPDSAIAKQPIPQSVPSIPTPKLPVGPKRTGMRFYLLKPCLVEIEPGKYQHYPAGTLLGYVSPGCFYIKEVEKIDGQITRITTKWTVHLSGLDVTDNEASVEGFRRLQEQLGPVQPLIVTPLARSTPMPKSSAASENIPVGAKCYLLASTMVANAATETANFYHIGDLVEKIADGEYKTSKGDILKFKDTNVTTNKKIAEDKAKQAEELKQKRAQQMRESGSRKAAHGTQQTPAPSTPTPQILPAPSKDALRPQSERKETTQSTNIRARKFSQDVTVGQTFYLLKPCTVKLYRGGSYGPYPVGTSVEYVRFDHFRINGALVRLSEDDVTPSKQTLETLAPTATTAPIILREIIEQPERIPVGAKCWLLMKHYAGKQIKYPIGTPLIKLAQGEYRADDGKVFRLDESYVSIYKSDADKRIQMAEDAKKPKPPPTPTPRFPTGGMIGRTFFLVKNCQIKGADGKTIIYPAGTLAEEVGPNTFRLNPKRGDKSPLVSLAPSLLTADAEYAEKVRGLDATGTTHFPAIGLTPISPSATPSPTTQR